MGFQQLQASSVVGVVSVDVGVERARVDDQCDGAISERKISSMRFAMLSLGGLCPSLPGRTQ
jgi:hypothetical protein